MGLEQWGLYLSITLAVSLSPGPVMLLCLAQGAGQAFSRVLAAMLGASAGNLVLMALSLLGLAGLMQAWPALLQLLGLLGAAYLGYIAWQYWRQPARDYAQAEIAPQRLGQSLGRGFWVALSNPKGLIYFGALFPPFMQDAPTDYSRLAQLTAAFLAMDLCIMLLYAKAGAYVHQTLADPHRQRLLHRCLALLLALMALLLALQQLPHR
jgi:homoserine/homoserine lactone efflux protein